MTFKEFLIEKWGKDVEIKHTGEWEGKSVGELKKKASTLKNKENKSEAEKKDQKQVAFAIRAKTGWKKGKGATK